VARLCLALFCNMRGSFKVVDKSVRNFDGSPTIEDKVLWPIYCEMVFVASTICLILHDIPYYI
jgi:hypothetical protein